MRRSVLLSMFAAAGWLLAGAPAHSQSDPNAVELVPDEVVMKIRADAFHGGTYRAELGTQGRTGLVDVDAVLAQLAATKVSALFSLAVNAEMKREMGMDRIVVIKYSRAESPVAAADRLAQLADVEWAEPNSIGHGTFTPNDPTYPLQWGHKNRGQAIRAPGDSVGSPDCDIDTNQAWDIQTGSLSVTLAVLDTGIDAGHPEFAGRVLGGYDFVNEDSNPNDDHGHGTSCAGIAAAAGNNSQGVAGVAWGVRILPVKVLNAANGGNETDLAQGLVFAADNNARVISMSLGGYANQQALYDAVRYAFNLNCSMFAATGNGNASSIAYPSAWSETIAVGALSPCNERKSPTSCDGENSWGSNYGTGIDLMAPGVKIHTTDIRGAGGFRPGDYMESFNGTSAATPFAAGIAALVLSQAPLSRAEVLTVMTDSCDDLGAPSYDTQFGFGRINAYVALRRVSGAIFVGANTGFENGSYTAPYNTVLEGVNLVPVDNFVVIKPGNYDEATPWSNINKKMHWDAIDGGVTIH
jgi:subtilisin family serine protease